MPDPRDTPVLRWGEEIRRRRQAARTGRRRTLLLLTVAVVAAVGATLLWAPRPVLLWNASASSPLGLYLVRGSEPAVGSTAIVRLPSDLRPLAADRGYLPRNVPLVKRVAAAGGDRVCAVGEAVFVNGRLEALRRDRDGAGRAMPWWTGCEELRRGDIFVIGSSPGSFDGRYFGPSRASEIVGTARLLWAR